MKLRTNVLVVGGGPAGATAARFLAESGSDVILLERNLSFFKPCGGGVPSSAFEEFNIPKTLIKKEVKKIKLVSPTDEILDIDLKGGNLAIVKRGEFDTVLRNIADKQGAKLLEGEFVRFIDGTKYRTEAIIKTVKTEIISEYIIASDGVNSRVKAALGIKSSQAIFTGSELIKDLFTDSCEFWFGSHHAPGFYSWVFPATNGASLGTGTLQQGTINTLLESFKKRRGILQVGSKKVYRMPVWKGDLYNKGKILFAGDSAGHVLPFIYEGIYYAMKAGELAARAIIEGKADNYKKMWKDVFLKRFILMNKLKDYFLKNDTSSEKFIALHRKPEVQEASMRLWLRKDRSSMGLKDYIKLFGKFLN
jgi:geranylgeranyl reductase